jgi:hypothetical protein
MPPHTKPIVRAVFVAMPFLLPHMLPEAARFLCMAGIIWESLSSQAFLTASN